jgi:signal transduction histidine kinase
VPYLEPDAEAWRKHRETLEAHLPFRDFELARPAADGGKRYISVSGLPVFDRAGRFIGYRGVARHITERKRAEEALRDMQMKLAHANRVATMGQLSASITHEVKQPIAAARNNARAALKRSAVWWAMPIEQAKSSTGSAGSSRRRRPGKSAWTSTRVSAR